MRFFLPIAVPSQRCRFVTILDTIPPGGQERKNASTPQITERLAFSVVRPRGFEPLTFGSGGRRSIQLSYGRAEMRWEANKPSSVSCLARRRRLAPTRPARRRRTIYLGRRSPAASSGLPGTPATWWSQRRGPRHRPCLALLRVGFTVPPPLPGSAVGSYPTVSPLPDPHTGPSAVCSLWHFPSRCRARVLPGTLP